MILRNVIFLGGLLWAVESTAYDSRCRLESPDCEGVEAAHVPWHIVEHGFLWRSARIDGGLSPAIDEPFVVHTFSSGGVGTSLPSLRPSDLLLDRQIARDVEVAAFAQLPDLSFSLWDWVSGNEGCPPVGLVSEPVLIETEQCHAFKAHMGWLNSTHFLPQAEQYFEYLHDLALDRAGDCAVLLAQFDVAGIDGTDILNACDREALIIEAQAHHYLQDAWSMGHMWQRWGSPELSAFQQALNRPGALITVKALGDAVGRGSGIIHGSKAITTFDDAMCAPDNGVDFIHEGVRTRGGGDLFLQDVLADELLAGQSRLLRSCTASALREVYLSSAQSFGPAGVPVVETIELSRCFPQRATNRAVALGAAIQLPPGTFDVALLGNFVDAHVDYLTSIGLDPDNTETLYLPLTSVLLTRLNDVVDNRSGEPLIAEEILTRWHEDMSRIQTRVEFSATADAEGTALAEGAMGSLLGMQRNDAYNGVPSYADPPLPWRPEPNEGGPILPSIENAGNLLARTFVDAHATDWCEAMTRNEPHEFSLERLRRECDSEGDGCIPCEKFAAWHLSSTRLGDTPLCDVIAPGSVIISANFIDADSRESLATQWCRNSPRINIVGQRLVSPDEDVLLVADVIGLADQSVNWSTEAGATISTAGVFRASEPGIYLVSAESVELPGITGFFVVDVQVGASLVGTWSGDSLSFDGQDEVPVGSPGIIAFSIALVGDVPTLSHDSSTYPLTIENGRLTGTNGRTDAGRRDFDATVVDDTMIGVITIQETPPSRIEFEVVKQ